MPAWQAGLGLVRPRAFLSAKAERERERERGEKERERERYNAECQHCYISCTKGKSKSAFHRLLDHNPPPPPQTHQSQPVHPDDISALFDAW